MGLTWARTKKSGTACHRTRVEEWKTSERSKLGERNDYGQKGGSEWINQKLKTEILKIQGRGKNALTSRRDHNKRGKVRTCKGPREQSLKRGGELPSLVERIGAIPQRVDFRIHANKSKTREVTISLFWNP